MTGKKKSTSVAPIILEPMLLIKDIDRLKAMLLECLETEGTVVVDASKVEAVDTSALQLLVAFARALREQSRTLEWLPSDAFTETAALVDLLQPLNLDAGTTVNAKEAQPAKKTKSVTKKSAKKKPAKKNEDTDDGLLPVF